MDVPADLSAHEQQRGTLHKATRHKPILALGKNDDYQLRGEHLVMRDAHLPPDLLILIPPVVSFNFYFSSTK